MANLQNTLTAMTFTPEEEQRFLNPEPGTAGWRAKEFGIDLTLTLASLKMTVEERVETLEGLREFAREARQAMLRAQNKLGAQ
ncbi:MAG: hypothetical protein SF097_23380 [Acidobacteriota bacterium]|nr:hypothetical protein [Acidobacteriota bacterium]